jgi:hypothetical protein
VYQEAYAHLLDSDMIFIVLKNVTGEDCFMAEQKVKKAEPVAAPKKKNTKKIVLIVVAVVVALFIIIFVSVTAATSAPVKASNSLVNYIKAQNASAAYSLLSSGAKGTISEADFVAVVDQIGPILTGTPDMQSKEVSGEAGAAATARVVYEIKGNDSLTYVFTVNLVKESGEWKVLNFDSTKK